MTPILPTVPSISWCIPLDKLKPTLREVALFGILGALTFGAKVAMSFLPNIEPVSLFRIGLATPISTVIQIILCVGFFVVAGRTLKKNQKNTHFEETRKN